jgi:hypothetical protein
MYTYHAPRNPEYTYLPISETSAPHMRPENTSRATMNAPDGQQLWSRRDSTHSLPNSRTQPRLLTVTELDAIPPVTWLLEGILPRGGFACVYGPPAVGKTFLALDWALSVSCGRDWFGKPVQKGLVVYIAAEGLHSIKPRMAAWQEARHVPHIEDFLTLDSGLNLLEANAADWLLTEIAAKTSKQPALFVVDTLARCMGDGDENTAQAMGAFIKSIDRLRLATGATVLAVHHPGKQVEKGARGSSALKAAVDAEMEVTSRDGLITLASTKQKDAALFDSWRLKLTTVGTGAVLNPATGCEPGDRLISTQQQVLELLAEVNYQQGTTRRELISLTGLSDKAIDKALHVLNMKGFVQSDGPPKSTKRLYSATMRGTQALRSNTDSPSFMDRLVDVA